MRVKNVKRLRLRLTLTIEELATKSDLAIFTIRRAEMGENLRISNVRKLAEALGVEPSAIMIEEEEEDAPTKRATVAA